MPEISVFSDVEEMDNRYTGKCVVYVEGKDDQNVWERIAGSDLAGRVEFKVPLAEGTGSEMVLNRVNAERPSNSRIFGLVDGEVAAGFGEVIRLIECSDILFDLHLPKCDGIMFLSAHELENVLIGNSDLMEFIEHNVGLKNLGSRKREEVEKKMLKLAKRFYVAALIKYAWAHMNYQGFTSGIGNVDHFRSDGPLMGEIKRAKQKIEQEFGENSSQFRQQLIQIAKSVETKIDNVKKGGGRADEEIVRLADGKGLLIKLQSHWRFRQANEGLLVERVCLSDFAKKFQKQLVCITGA